MILPQQLRTVFIFLVQVESQFPDIILGPEEFLAGLLVGQFQLQLQLEHPPFQIDIRVFEKERLFGDILSRPINEPLEGVILLLHFPQRHELFAEFPDLPVLALQLLPGLGQVLDELALNLGCLHDQLRLDSVYVLFVLVQLLVGLAQLLLQFVVERHAAPQIRFQFRHCGLKQGQLVVRGRWGLARVKRRDLL